MTRCHTCSRPVGLADQHLFDPVHVYCEACCPACKPAVCAVDGCDLLAMTRGWCQKHYTRWRRHGDPGHTERPGDDGWPLDALMARTDTNGPGGCWLWTGQISSDGYGRAGHQYAHRLMYERAIGPIPEGLHIDHVHAWGCRHRHCVNPSHLEPVTKGENSRRALKNQVEACPQGHPYDQENTYVHPVTGHRSCRACHRMREAERAHRRGTPRRWSLRGAGG